MTKPEARVVPARPASSVDLSVLSLVPVPDSVFYADQLAELSELGVETTVLPASSSEPPAVASRSEPDVRRLAAEVADRPLAEYDLVHAIHGRTGAAALAQTDLPVVLSLWGADRRGRDDGLEIHAARRADAVLVPSASVGESIDMDCAVVPRGVDLERVRPQPRDKARAALGWDAAAKHVFRPAASARSDDGHDLAARVVATAEGRLDESVALHAPDSPVPYGEMAIYLSAADAMVLPREFERSPTAAAEAMACNLPVVTTADDDVAERLAAVDPSPVCGSESALADALVEVLRRGERSTGRAHARDLHTERTAWRVREVYRDVLERDS